MSSEEPKKEETEKKPESAGTPDESDKPAPDGAPLVKILDKTELKTAEEDETSLAKEFVFFLFFLFFFVSYFCPEGGRNCGGSTKMSGKNEGQGR